MAADSRPLREVVAPVQDRWTIDVCKTCGAVARWPFCEHGGGARGPEDPIPEVGWCIPVQVKPCYPGEFRATMARVRRAQAES
jgi:hypothetical protein